MVVVLHFKCDLAPHDVHTALENAQLPHVSWRHSLMLPLLQAGQSPGPFDLYSTPRPRKPRQVVSVDMIGVCSVDGGGVCWPVTVC